MIKNEKMAISVIENVLGGLYESIDSDVVFTEALIDFLKEHGDNEVLTDFCCDVADEHRRLVV
jgi:hypothetical protein